MENCSIELYGIGDISSAYYLGEYNSKNYEGIYYPKDPFDRYVWNIDFQQEDPVLGITYSNTFGGKIEDIPNSISQLEFSTKQLPKSIDDYQSGCDNENVDVVINTFFDDGQWITIYGPNNAKLDITPVVDLIKNIYPEYNITLSQLSSTLFYEYEDQSYDEFVARSSESNSSKQYREIQP